MLFENYRSLNLRIGPTCLPWPCLGINILKDT
jgi:hypothetical protein